MDRSLVIFFAWLALGTAAFSRPLLHDAFDDGAVDSAIWTVVKPFVNAPPTTVTETNGALALFRRGVVEATAVFPPSIDIEGRFRFTGDRDALSIAFRSDLSVTNQFERRGVVVSLQQATGRFFLIRDPFSTSAPPVQGGFTFAKNQDYRFRIVDHEDVVRVYVENLLQPLMTLAVTNRRGDRLALYNATDTAARTLVDEFSVHPVGTTLFLDNRLVREGPIRRTNAVQVRIQTFFTNAQVFYTLDGSEPSFASSEYTAPFVVGSVATLRAIAYSPDFTSSSFSPAIELQIIPDVLLSNLTPGGGTVQFDPPGPLYPSNSVVTATAFPAPGWQFIRWEGAAAGESNPTAIAMTNHTGVRAVFAAAPVFTLVGDGQALATPQGSQIEYGMRARFTAYPSAGSYFVRWGNAVTGTNNPVSLVFTNPNTAVTVLFAVLGPNQVSLVTPIEGDGRIGSAPGGNTFALGQRVSLLAVPDADRVFLGWTGDATARTNPLSLLMDGSKIVTARFGQAVRFLPTSNQWSTDGFSLTITGQVGFTYELQKSPNFVDWTAVTTLFNETGRVTFLHTEALAAPASFYRVVGP